jgi:hypothetical protein
MTGVIRFGFQGNWTDYMPFTETTWLIDQRIQQQLPGLPEVTVYDSSISGDGRTIRIYFDMTIVSS